MILKDKVVMVSGIGPGLGQEMALLAAREGAAIAIGARTPVKLDAVEEELARDGIERVLKVPTDVRDRAQCARFVEQTVERFGRVDVLINSAYVTGAYTLSAEADLDDWREVMDVNLFGAMNLIQEAVPHMKRQGGGRIINVNTKVTRLPHALMGGYAVSKAALRMATAQLAKELGADGIRLNSVFPGWMWGPTVEQGFEARAAAEGRSVADIRAEIAAAIPIGDIPEDGDCAKAVIGLASDYFAIVTGACLDLSGGEYLPL
ncbi:SDR family NAD(P)-dependent oxidoreductase [Sphingobium sp. Sx8-8]|uniref:SDR family NAD(P)-dependent oxidoreductase n=1 Tax=Sphingobium sp. Sx8-8 TaxID=2933617 RepID=UPI001F59E2C0|nr:SDR family NAD(P)-dependent oxidoreductase [Sphingobium sp. Sx8-8]